LFDKEGKLSEFWKNPDMSVRGAVGILGTRLSYSFVPTSTQESAVSTIRIFGKRVNNNW